jgi:hypothetical protein
MKNAKNKEYNVHLCLKIISHSLKIVSMSSDSKLCDQKIGLSTILRADLDRFDFKKRFLINTQDNYFSTSNLLLKIMNLIIIK